MNILNNSDIPMGLGMALAQNTDAMAKFTAMSDTEKQTFINGTHSINSKQEMKEYVASLLTK